MLNKLLKFYFFCFCFSALAYEQSDSYLAHKAPKELEGIGVKERLGNFIDLNLSFKNEQAQSLPLKTYFKKGPVLMTVIYYNCPSLCNFHLNGLFEGLEKLSLQSNRDYQLIAISMDASEQPSLAQKKKKNYLKKFPLAAEGIHFLTGSKQAIKKLTQQVGFSFRWDEETEQYAHSPVAYALTASGLISRYLYGVEFDPQTLKMSLLEAGQGKIGNVVDRILLFCYRFNSNKNRYTLYAYNIMRLGGILTIVLLLIFLIPIWLRARNE